MSNNNTEIIDCLDIEKCFDLIFDPPQSFLDDCKKYWDDFFEKIMLCKPEVPTFYAIDENGVEYFYHGKNRIRVSEHFAEKGKTYGEITADTIRYVVRRGEEVPLSYAC